MESGASDQQPPDEAMPRDTRSRRPRKRVVIPVVLAALMAVAAIAAWLARERIADDIIADQLAAYDLPATYTVEQVGGTRQVIDDLKIGDPDAPDFTARRVIVTLRYGIGLPQVASVTLVAPRIYGSYRKGVLSFGALDKVIFAESDQPPGLPDLHLDIRDGRGLIESDWGPVGLKAEGKGPLSSGFAGILAVNAPRLAFADCIADRATAFGRVITSAGEPSFAGPLRLAALACGEGEAKLSHYAAEVEAELDRQLANPVLTVRLDGGQTRFADYSANGVTGTVRAQMRGSAASARFSLAGRGVSSPHMLAAVLTAEGQARGPADLARLEIDSQVEGNGLRPGPRLVTAINGIVHSGKDTLLAPLAGQIGRALQAETRGSAFAADLRLRKTGARLTVLAPNAALRGGSGARIVALSRVEMLSDGAGLPRMAGDISTGGAGLPRITGRMVRKADGVAELQLAMERYAAGDAALAVPQMVVEQAPSGALRFDGTIEASGSLPGGAARNLRLPVSGTVTSDGDVAVWKSCTEIGFDRLELANLRFERRRLTLCPAPGRAIMAMGRDGLHLAAGLPALALEGFLGETPIRIASGPIGFAYPGAMSARAVDVSLGPPNTASRFRIVDLDARIGDTIAGTFSDADVRLAAVPLNLEGASGRWDYAGGTVTVAGASFTLSDRQDPARFEPLVARDATLTLADNTIAAHAEMRHPATDRLVAIADIRHNLASAAGHAEIAVPGLQFDQRLQPDQLTYLALGVIANAQGVISGTGRIDWDAVGEVRSSGMFGTTGLDFAAAFGPVKGASGQIEFTDLLNLTTRPGQKLTVSSINPGVEVLDGEIDFALRDGKLLAVEGGSWPFMGGRLILRRFDFNFGASEERRYIFEIVGLEAAQFVAQMDLENLTATGVFDGTVPIVFDANGNGRIDSGVLISRPPGGNLSYVGELTYEDLSPIANFAFDALRSLDYSQMRVVMDGPLTGEIVTRVRFDGVSQGQGAKSNFLTRRLAALPLQFRINVKAQFYQLLTSLKSLYDPAAVRDPRELGLLSDDGKHFVRRKLTGEDAEPQITPGDLIPGEPPIQEQESE